MNGDVLGYYAALEVSVQASAEEIKKNYRELAKIWHPDQSEKENALDVFQKISRAYEVLKDEDKRLVYDLLCSVYIAENFPDMSTLKTINSKSFPENLNIRLLHKTTVYAWLAGFKVSEDKEVCTYAEALKKLSLAAIVNGLCGWWHPKAAVKNIEALVKNFYQPFKRDENLKLYVHNALAYRQENQPHKSAVFVGQALLLADSELKTLLQKFLSRLNVGQPRPVARWNTIMLRAVQLFLPVVLLFAVLFSFSAQIVSESDLMNYFNKKREVSYYQEVNFRGGRGVDDVVVGKVVNIPVNLEDESKLYHFIRDAKVMHGPSDSFDVMTTVSSRTTVRITGITPDELWFRVMLDNGEMGFVRREHLNAGRGKEIPPKSRIISSSGEK